LKKYAKKTWIIIIVFINQNDTFLKKCGIIYYTRNKDGNEVGDSAQYYGKMTGLASEDINLYR
jgi:hypothetical protein